MAIYPNSTADTYWGHKEANFRHPCEVIIADGAITVSYEDEGRFIVYKGDEVGSGHWSLTAEGVNGRATLHKIPNEDVLEGSWVEGGYDGMWRIDLEE